MTDYKNTLNLPKTDFAMKANLAQREPARLKDWQQNDIYQKIRAARHGAKPFIMHDGPPYANGDIHLGHALNKTLKDIIVKAKTLSGFNVPFVPGWDCHGLPIELNVEKKKGKPGHKISAKQFRQACRDYAKTQIAKQKEQFQRLGIFAEWNNPYLTMNYKFEANVVRSLASVLQNGYIKRGVKPVYWCLNCASALAEAEVEYHDKASRAIDVKFMVTEPDKLAKAFAVNNLSLKAYIPIWTTTPWTLPANEAVTLGADIDYVLLQAKRHDQQELLVIAAALQEKISERYDLSDVKVIAKTKGQALEHLKLQHPIYNKQVPICLGDHVTTEDGTGCVHTAPAHGVEDYGVGLAYDLPIGIPVLDNGCYADDVELLAGKFVRKVDEDILQLLHDRHTLLVAKKLHHSYPHCWRHKTPLIFRATPQWFIHMDANNLRQESQQATNEVNWFPQTGENRMLKMLEGRPDWCISRQRAWGVPIPFITHQQTGELHADMQKLLEIIATKVEQEGIEAWFELSLEELIGDEAPNYSKSTHVLDVWFDSGVTHACVLDARDNLHSPADVVLEGSDQYRGWFQSSLLTSVAMKQQAPYKDVITHGFTVDSKGHKMSKSLGNVIAPDKIIKTYGADMLRLWVASTDYQHDMSLSDEILKRSSEAYRRMRNTARFLLSNLHGFVPSTDLQKFDDLVALDRWVIARALQVQQQIMTAYDNYEFHVVYQLLYRFCIVDLGNFYLDIIKDRQYTAKTKGHARLSGQTAMYHVLHAFVRWLAPICSFTADEIWQSIPGEKAESVFIATWYDQLQALDAKAEMNNDYWQTILNVRDEVNKAIEAKRHAGEIGGALEAEVVLYADSKLQAQLQQLKDELRFVLITSEAEVKALSEATADASDALEGQLKIAIITSDKQKCERCWQRRADVDSYQNYPGICGRCVENIAGEGEKRCYA